MSYDQVKTIRVDGEEWDKAKDICDELHVSMSTVVNILIKQIIVNRGIPIGISLNECKDKETLRDEFLSASGIDSTPDDLIGTYADVPIEEKYKPPVEEPIVISVEEKDAYKNFVNAPAADSYITKSKKNTSSDDSFDMMSGLFD